MWQIPRYSLHKNFTRQYILMIMHYIHLPSTVFIFILLLPFSFFGWSATNKLYLSWNMESFYIKRINIVSHNSLFTRRSNCQYSYFLSKYGEDLSLILFLFTISSFLSGFIESEIRWCPKYIYFTSALLLDLMS